MSRFADLANELRLPQEADETPGFRPAQLAAVHATCGHFWDKTRPALVVMPTGSGKTAVMQASSIALRASRVLVVAPSRLLREQLADAFRTLSVLEKLGAIAEGGRRPRVHEVRNRIGTKKEWAALRASDVVVGIPSSISPGLEGVFQPPADMFDVVLFDEAHHLPARSFAAIAQAFPAARHVLFTATPFRRDEREIRADLIFSYSLAQARRDGVFGRLHFSPVQPTKGEGNDEAIAKAAAAQVARDRKANLNHRLVVRAASRERADELAALYEAKTKLNLKRLHSGLSYRFVRKTIDELRRGEIDGVVAVDMLGEGFDLPELKVAALHTPHRSLAVTLQFIGRFARTTGDSTGTATFFAVADEVYGEAERLFVPGAEWNEIVEELSQERIATEQETRAVVDSFAPLGENLGAGNREAQRAQVWSLRPYFHAKVYEAASTVNLEADLALPTGVEPVLIQRSERENAIVTVGRATVPARWSTSDSWLNVAHELFVVLHAPEERLVFICTSRRDSAVYDDLIDSVTENAHRLAPNEIKRVLRGVENQELFSLGMRNRAGVGGAGAESYRIYSGRSADKAIRASDVELYDQGHAFCRGKEGGEAVTIGFSSGSKIWTNRWDQLPELFAWLRSLAAKLRDARSLPHGSNFDRLSSATRITSLPHSVIAADLPVAAYRRGSAKVRAGTETAWLVDFDVRIVRQNGDDVDIALQSGAFNLPFRFDVRSRPHFRPLDGLAKSAMVTDAGGREDAELAAFLNEYPPTLYLENLAVVVGDTMSEPPDPGAAAIALQLEPVDWVAEGVNHRLEKPVTGRGRRAGNPGLSLFEYVERRARKDGAAVIFNDDGPNEIADFVIVRPEADRTLVQIVHCKAAHSDDIPAHNVGDLYEVVGQAVKCRRWLDARRLLEQVDHRNANTKSHFVLGNARELERHLENRARLAFEVVVVQPGLSTQPNSVAVALLSAVDAYHRGADRPQVRFLATAPRSAT